MVRLRVRRFSFLFSAVRPGSSLIPPPGRVRLNRSGLTLLELMTVLVVISILVVVLAPGVSFLQARAQKAQCIGNLRSLHVATGSYMQDNQHWPQISGNGYQDKTVAGLWLAALAPYGLSQINWVCPTVQRELHAPDLADPENVRVDYLAMPFGTQPRAPYLYARQPWFIEVGNVHGNGQEIIFPDGHIEEALDLFHTAQPASGN